MYEINLQYVSICHIYFITGTLVHIVIVVVVVAFVFPPTHIHTYLLLWESLNGKINILLHVRTTTTRLRVNMRGLLCCVLCVFNTLLRGFRILFFL